MANRRVSSAIRLGAAKRRYPLRIASTKGNVRFDPLRVAKKLAPSSPSEQRHLAALLETSFAASLFTDEGRPLRVLLLLPIERVSFPSELRLSAPKLLSTKALKRFALAVTPERAGLRVKYSAPRSFRVLSIVPRARQFDPRVVEIECRGPGQIRARRKAIEVRFDRDQETVLRQSSVADSIINPSSADQLVRVATRPAIRTTETAGDSLLLFGSAAQIPLVVDAGIWKTNLAKYRGIVRGRASSTLEEGVRRLVRATGSLGHGGSFFILPHPMRGRRQLQGGIVTTAGGAWNGGLLEHLIWVGLYELLEDCINPLAYERPSTHEGAWVWRNRFHRARISVADRQWRTDAESIANLTQVDGAVVLDATLSPVSFGTTLRHRGTRIPAETKRFLDSRGHRHKSIAQAVSQTDGSMGIVVSQDGEVTLFRKPERHRLIQEAVPI